MSTLERVFSDRDFEDMLFPVHTVPDDGNAFAEFKAFEKLPSFAKFKDPTLPRTRVIKYVVFCYDRNSPIFIKFKGNEVKRKTISALYAGWEPDPREGLFVDFVDRMLRGFNADVNKMIIDYVRLYHDPEYSVLVSGYEALYRKLEVLNNQESDFLKGKDDLKNEELSGKLFIQSKNMAEELNSLAHKILTDDNKYLKKDLFSIIDESIKNKLNISPERRAGIM